MAAGVEPTSAGDPRSPRESQPHTTVDVVRGLALRLRLPWLLRQHARRHPLWGRILKPGMSAP